MLCCAALSCTGLLRLQSLERWLCGGSASRNSALARYVRALVAEEEGTDWLAGWLLRSDGQYFGTVGTSYLMAAQINLQPRDAAETRWHYPVCAIALSVLMHRSFLRKMLLMVMVMMMLLLSSLG